MSAEATSWAYKIVVVVTSPDEALVERLKMAPKFLLVTLANYADEEHSSFPSFNKLAERMSCSRSTVIEAVKVLEKHGLVVIQKRRRENKSHTSSRYYLPVDNWAPKILDPSPDSGPGAPDQPVDNSPEGSAESGPAPSGFRTPLNRHPNRRDSSYGPVPETSHETAVDNSGGGLDPKNIPNPAAIRATHGHPLQPADVFASVGRILPDTFDDEALEQLAAEILAKAATRVLDPTAYVISVIRSWRRPNMTGGQLVDAGEWWAVVDRIDRDRQFSKLIAPLEADF